jgi:hypothetical protein
MASQLFDPLIFGHTVPDTTDLWDLGSSTKKWRNGYFSGTVYAGGYATLTTNSFAGSGGNWGTGSQPARYDHTHAGSANLSASQTLNQTVAANTFYTVTVTVAGASLGDPCVANHSGFTGSRVWMFNAQVTATDTVTVTYWLADGTSGILSGTLKVIVFK